MKALYSGPCVECDDPIEEGQDIQKTLVGWAHVNCPDSERLTSVLQDRICHVCWQVKATNGACGCP